MGKWMRRAVLVLTAASALLVSSCTGEAKPNASTAASTAPGTSAASPSASPAPTDQAYPADVPLTGRNLRPGEKPPLYPAAARARTQAGANAFAEFFLRTLDWAYATTNPSYMRHYSGPSCGLCNDLATEVRNTAAVRHWYEGGRLTIRPAIATPVGPVTAPADFCSTVNVDSTAHSVVDRAGTVFTEEAAHPNFRWKLCVKASSDRWQVTYFAAAR
ncbi:MAG TPA: DUF6318 family protein [Jatrophihabitans sp.]|jgi:hypothetical protein|uniref:DUF6318 family protein n=1 Tax=Jatrophihabitans sp. TaxID=1932789 RepID=UPI002F090143